MRGCHPAVFGADKPKSKQSKHDAKESHNRQAISADYTDIAEFSVSRKKVEDALNLYWETLHNLKKNLKRPSEESSVNIRSLYLQTAKLVESKQKCVNREKRIGEVSGIKVGDVFQWRAELWITGLHLEFWKGIAYMNMNGKIVATSIVDSGRYDNRGKLDILIYSGEGKRAHDQRLERGNLALKNSMDLKTPVRVIRKIENICKTDKTSFKDYKFIYHGLYMVDNCWEERGKFGKLVFKFQLKRFP